MNRLAGLSILLALLLPSTALGSDSNDQPPATQDQQQTNPQLSREDQDVIAQLELLEMLDMLENLDTVAAMEDAQ
ncbi:hypothetical protein C2E25_00110 [Geothermobacter hydrogeniphilus]|uniref:Uncharacterized protein n=1 Tax=Geothermobacter hydrogeniphilus TaxID=1969733 RepID=A0A2K2HEL9_9BACT|nr:hypothetical protein [Geothermobacter hydrogeniphilus]PNU21671.1 hypothetical protein C2E25_00110 [Geothermobacter hydrogeniphilus]